MSRKNALITGGSRGLGLAVGRLLAENGYRVTAVARNAENLEAAIRSFAGDGHRCWPFDLSQPSQAQEVLRRLEDEVFDLLINNAGASRFGLFSELSTQAIEELIYLNFTAPALISRQFLRKSRPGATLVNVTSILATVPIPGNSLYSAAKAGLKTLSECLWFEARGKGVRVLDFRTATLKTDFHRLAGRESVTISSIAVDPATAARDLVRAIEGGREFVYCYRLFAWIVEFMNRLLPRKFLIHRLGKRASKAGYLVPTE
jgi:short-subunit dehydrogenase